MEQRVLEPMGWTIFKNNYPQYIGTADHEPPMQWSPVVARWVGALKPDVNTGIEAQPDRDSKLLDPWDVWPKIGNCCDYTVTKRAEMLDEHKPASCLLIAEIELTPTLHHLVLVLRTTNGLIVLDNRTPALMSLQDTGYKVVRMQSSKNFGWWITETAAAGLQRS